MAPPRTVGSSTSILPLINAGHVSSIWHDILLNPPPSPANEFSSPRHPGPPFPACTFSFVCRSAKSPSADCGSRELRRRDDPLFLREKRKVVLGLDGSHSLLTACDNVPLEALEIGSQTREPGDVYDVFPLLAMPLRLLGAERNSMPISWRIVTIAADDELVTSGQLKHSMRDLLDRVRDWANKTDFFGEIVGPGRSPNPCFGASPSPSPADAAEKEARGRPLGLEGLRTKSLERGAWGGGSGGSGGALMRISRIGGRDSLIGRVTLGAEEPGEEWGKSAREAEGAEEAEDQAEQAAMEAREAEAAEKAAEQAREAEQTVLYAHSTWRILCPSLRRPVLKRLGSSHLPEKHHGGSHLPEKQQQQQERQNWLVRSPPVPACRSAYALPDSSYSASSESDSISYKAACSSRVAAMGFRVWSLLVGWGRMEEEAEEEKEGEEEE
ncbi:unnamed protein product [Closterium sp. Naga37s-1]|nr:unnamed protein product [Closterium sp. Naga37s-1]